MNDAQSPASKPTVVLVHGAFADSSSWNGVIKDLRREGYPVIAPANPLRGLHEDAAYLRAVLDSVPGPVVLAGHSYGGSVLSEAADGSANVKALVYIASFQPDVGESTSALAAKFPGGKLGEALHTVSVPLAGGGTATDLYIEQDKFRAVFAADVPGEIAELMAATQRPITSAALDDTATKTAWKTIPSWSLITTQDLAIPADSMRFMSQRANSHTTEIDASHAVTVSQPHAVSNIIVAAAQGTTG
ncbi:alpha/beta hydrolase [Streptomyces sp. NPDC029554]|uniref:alpha/beta fold hydrolase n=1 Tax=Streptomyces sp. NPDC029554 TaxID=3155126 RepID=UPI0033DCA4B4